MKTAFLGLGVMGYPMAGHLAAAGHAVTVYNRTGAKAEAWAKAHPGAVAHTPGEAASGADIVFACVGDDPDAADVARAAFQGMADGALYVEHTTASPDLARTLADEAGAKGMGFVDAPVSGGQAGAENAKLTIMCGAEPEDFDRAEPVMRAYGARIVRIGGVGSGQLAKCVNQICIAGAVQGVAEALHFAERAGLDPEKVVDAVSAGSGQSWQLENRWRTMVDGEFDFGFAVNWMRKDLRIVLQEARKNGARLSATALIDQYYAEVQAMGGGRWDTSSLIARLQRD